MQMKPSLVCSIVNVLISFILFTLMLFYSFCSTFSLSDNPHVYVITKELTCSVIFLQGYSYKDQFKLIKIMYLILNAKFIIHNLLLNVFTQSLLIHLYKYQFNVKRVNHFTLAINYTVNAFLNNDWNMLSHQHACLLKLFN